MSDPMIRPGNDVDQISPRLREGRGEVIAADASLPDDHAATDPAALPMLAIPYAFARRHGVVLQPHDPDALPAVALREGADPRALIEVRRVLGRAFDVAVVQPAAFDRLLSDNYAMDGQATAAAAVATKVLMKASAATPFASRLEPALKPNQPIHSSEAPIIVIVSECGGIGSDL